MRQTSGTSPRFWQTIDIGHFFNRKIIMNEKPPTENDLRDQLNELRDHFPKLKDDELFLVWFLRAFITESEDDAVE